MSRSQRYNDNDDDDNSDYSYEVTSNEDDDDDDDDFQIHKNKNLSPSYIKSPFELNVPQNRHMQYQQHQQLSHQRQQPQQNRMLQKQKSKQKIKAKHYHVHPQRKPRRLFTPEEDQLLLSLVEKYGQNSWTDIAEKIPGRSSRQCKERYLTYLCPTVNHSPWNEEEDLLLIQKVHEMGKRWSDMSKFFNGRTANAIKNRYHLHLRGHFNDNRNKHQLAQQHHKDMSVPLCSRTHPPPIPHSSPVVMNTISSNFPGIPNSSTASSSPLTAGPPPSSSATVFYAYPSSSFHCNSNTYQPNLNGIILIPSNYDVPVKERNCDILPNNNGFYNGYNNFAPIEPQYTNITPINVQNSMANVSNASSSANAPASNFNDFPYYNNNNYYPNSSSKINSFNQPPPFVVNSANQSINPNLNINPPMSSRNSMNNNRNANNFTQLNYSSVDYNRNNERKEISTNSHMIFEPISQIDASLQDNKSNLISNIDKKPFDSNDHKNYQISNFLVNSDNNFQKSVSKMEEKPKEGHSKTRILLPPLQPFFP